MSSSLQDTPSGMRLAITFFGKRNVGKSSLINLLTEQDIALVSSHAGMTTDPVKKAMEILPIGPVLITDTAGLDDDSEVGELRIKRTLECLTFTDIALFVLSAETGIEKEDEDILSAILKEDKPIIAVVNKVDAASPAEAVEFLKAKNIKTVLVSTTEKLGLAELKNAIIELKEGMDPIPTMLEGWQLKAGDIVVFVTPIDSAAPKGRLILPQVMALRDALDLGVVGVVTKETTLAETLRNFKKEPALVVTDSNCVGMVADILEDYSKNVRFTTFSILLAVQKLGAKAVAEGLEQLKSIPQNPKVLIAEGCTHHKQKDDIGSVKIPNIVRKLYGENSDISFSRGLDFPDPTNFDLIIHCGACTLNAATMRARKKLAKSTPFVNFGIFLAYEANGSKGRTFCEMHKNNLVKGDL